MIILLYSIIIYNIVKEPIKTLMNRKGKIKIKSSLKVLPFGGLWSVFPFDFA